jgi:hypothetical protein
MRIESGKHAVDRGLDELSVVGFLDVIGTHSLEYVAKQAELTICVGSRVLRACAIIQQKAGLGCDQRHGYACRRAEENQGSFAHHARTFWPSFAAHHGPGSTGTPSLAEFHI